MLGKFDDGGVPVALRRRRGDDGTREDEARTMGRAARSRVARSDVEGRPEKLRAPARCGDDRVVDWLREKKERRASLDALGRGEKRGP